MDRVDEFVLVKEGAVVDPSEKNTNTEALEGVVPSIM